MENQLIDIGSYLSAIVKILSDNKTFYISFVSTFFVGIAAVAAAVSAFKSKKAIDKTMLPAVNIGLLSRKIEGGANITMVSIHNLSNFPIWIWLNMDFSKESDFSENKKLIKTPLSYPGYPISPNYGYEFPYKEIDLLIEKYGKIYARIQYRCNITSSPPGKDIKPTELSYRYESDQGWLINGLGMSFTPLYRR